MEGYRIVGLRIDAPMKPIKLKSGKFVAVTKGVSGEHIHHGEFTEYSVTEISMPVGTIFMNYVPDSFYKDWPNGTLYCLVPEGQIEGV